MKSLHVSARACLFPVKSQRAQAVWGKPLFTTYDIRSKVVFNVRFHTFHKVFDKSYGVPTIIQILGNNFENITFVFGACTSRMIEVVNFHSPGIQRHQNQKRSGEDERNFEVFHDDQMTDSVSCKISKFIVNIAYNYKDTF